ncbi:unnamed protein product, partial [Vitis vinifera]
MAGALAGGAFLSASLQVLFDRLASREVVSFIQGQKLSDALLKKLERKLLVVHAVLNDAEVKQFTNPYVKKWLVLLREAVYDAEDILDEITTEALRHKVEAAESQTSTSQVGNIMDMSTWVLAPFDGQGIESRVEEIIDRLEDMARDRDVLGLKEGDGEKLSQRWPSTSLVDESLVYGRDQIKEEMVQLLLSDNARSTDAMGLPLAIKAMGSLLHSKVEAREWDDVLNSELWDLPTNAVLPAPSCLNQMEKLINLCYLDIRYTSSVKEMPSDICKLKNLHSLSTFIVGQNGGLRLGTLRELSGSLVISKLQNVVCDRDALEANMKDKKYLDELKFEWDNESTDVGGVMQNRRDILSSLQPHTNLKRLHINSFSGLSFPAWVGDPSFFNLVDLGLQNCNNCSSLPPLGQLPSLKHLSILQMKGVKMVGSEFYGNASSSNTIKPSFPRGEFPRLQQLCINECPKLTGKLPKQLRSLKKLEISKCDSIEWVLEEGMLQGSTCLLQHLHITSCRFSRPLHSVGLPTTLKSLIIWECTKLEFLLPALLTSHLPFLEYLYIFYLKLLAHTHSSLQELRLIDCPELWFQKDGLPSDLREVEISSCNQLTSQVDWGLQRLASLTKFTISGGCQDMESFPKESLLPSTLSSLNISGLPNLKSLDSKGLQQLTSLTTLSISDCPKFQSFGEEGLQHLTSLEKLKMDSLPVLESLREVGLQHLTSLKKLSISNCPHLQCLTKERLPNSLSRLKIKSCPLLEHGCRFEKGQDWEYIAHIPRIVIGGPSTYKRLVFLIYACDLSNETIFDESPPRKAAANTHIRDYSIGNL